MREEIKAKLVVEAERENEIDVLDSFVTKKLEAAWAEIELAKRLIKLSEAELDHTALWSVYCFAAELSLGFGQTKEQFLDAVSKAYDEKVEEFDAEEEEPADLEDLIKNPLGTVQEGPG